MTPSTTDRPAGDKLSPTATAVLVLAFLLLIAALVGVIMWADTQMNRYERRAVDAEAVNATLNLLMETKKESLAVHGISIRRIIIRVEAGARP